MGRIAAGGGLLVHVGCLRLLRITAGSLRLLGITAGRLRLLGIATGSLGLLGRVAVGVLGPWALRGLLIVHDSHLFYKYCTGWGHINRVYNLVKA